MASLRNRNGTYYASFYDANRSPKEKRISLRTKDKSTARGLLAKMERMWQLGEADPWHDNMHAAIRPSESGENVTLSEALDRFLESRREMNCTDNTLRSYGEAVRGILRHANGAASARRLSASHVRSYVFSSDVKPTTQRKRYRHLNAILRWCKEEGLISENPLDSIPKPKTDSRLPVPTTEKDLRAVTEEIKAHYRKYRKTGEMKRGCLLWKINAFWLAYLTGLRRSELCRLRWRDVRLEERALILRKQKNRKGNERVPISEKAATLLCRMKRFALNDPQQFVIKSPSFTRTERNQQSFGNNLSRTWRKFRRKAGLSEEKDFHSLRKGFISRLAAKGCSAIVIKRLARHADIKTSLLYTALHNDDIRGHLNGAF